ncbi:hypothetical protein BD410DRAFT_203615 [Rickenella mellea]|uniref:Uncharacterized protein n=1 Tax=Rickenella mellea TaxID=50990 RepID=A0A4Y7PGM3_9AGAM|nr:hypothetical protein BD410DRAFT_203615 [Rickenella mellea]
MFLRKIFIPGVIGGAGDDEFVSVLSNASSNSILYHDRRMIRLWAEVGIIIARGFGERTGVLRRW